MNFDESGASPRRERILQEIDWEFLASLDGEESLLLLLSFLEGHPGYSALTRQALRAAMNSMAIPLTMSLSGRARPILLRLLRSRDSLKQEELEVLCRRLQEKLAWNEEDSFDLLEAFPLEHAPRLACNVARALPALSRLNLSKSLALWRRLTVHPLDGVRLVCLCILVRQGGVGSEVLVDLFRQSLASADSLFLLEIANSIPLEGPLSNGTICVLAAHMSREHRYEPLLVLIERLVAVPQELLHIVLALLIDDGFLIGAPTLASVRDAHTIPVYDLSAQEEAFEIEGGAYLKILDVLLRVASGQTGDVQVKMAKSLEGIATAEEEGLKSWLRMPPAQGCLTDLIDAWGRWEPARAYRLTLRFLELEILERETGEAVAFRLEKVLCERALERLAGELDLLPEGAQGEDLLSQLPSVSQWWLSDDAYLHGERIAVDKPRAVSALINFIAEPPDWLTGHVSYAYAASCLHGIIRPFPIGLLREIGLGIGMAMQASPERQRVWNVARNFLCELAFKLWKELADQYVAAELAPDAERLTKRMDLVNWCGRLPGSLFALLAHSGLREREVVVAPIGMRLALAVSRFTALGAERWPVLPQPLTPEAVIYLCRKIAGGLRRSTWVEMRLELAYMAQGVDATSSALDRLRYE